jgi:hypothetical protein
MLELIIEHYKPLGTILLITLVFIIANVVILWEKIQSELKENWRYYRTNPAIMLFAGFINAPENVSKMEYTQTNFRSLVSSIVKKFIDILMIPIYPIIQLFMRMMKMVSEVLNKLRNQMGVMRNYLFRLFEQVYTRLQNSVAAITFYLLKLREGLKRSYGLMNLMVYTAEHSYIFMQSLVSSPLGAFGEAAEYAGLTAAIFTFGVGGIPTWRSSLCFHPHTQIEMNDGSYKSIANVKLGEPLKDNNRVIAKIVSEVSTPMYSLNNVLVSSDHLVQYNNKWVRVRDCPHAKPIQYNDPNVVCFVTSSGIIDIQNTLFKDYLDIHCETKYLHIRHLIEKHLNKDTFYQSTDTCNDMLTGFHPNIPVNVNNVVGMVEIDTGVLTMYLLNGNILSGNALVQYYPGFWVRVHDHPDAEYIGHNTEKMMQYITTDGNVYINDNNKTIIRDLCEVKDPSFSLKLDRYVDYDDAC